ncbi:hypothetical protein ES288_D12G245300v1 [Gossypium darwinii]|uniref:Uncharacterized protein n=1 Tax=Gossypium darwinii TaxID=34276 RepID=A0A5D2ADI5_GOSDA|nr:hypothetical protein ES288_D12G245300v1 [Gossypium darwinii]
MHGSVESKIFFRCSPSLSEYSGNDEKASGRRRWQISGGGGRSWWLLKRRGG